MTGMTKMLTFQVLWGKNPTFQPFPFKFTAQKLQWPSYENSN